MSDLINVRVAVPLVPGTPLAAIAALVNAFDTNLPGCVLGEVIGDAVEVVLPQKLARRRRWHHWDDETKRAAVARAATEGPGAVAQELGVHRGTVSRWVAEASGV